MVILIIYLIMQVIIMNNVDIDYHNDVSYTYLIYFRKTTSFTSIININSYQLKY